MPILVYRKTGCNIHYSAVMVAPIGCVSEFDNSKEYYGVPTSKDWSHFSTSMTLPMKINQTV